jgi:hypothetical protein
MEIPVVDFQVTFIGLGTFLAGVGAALSGVAAFMAVRKRKNGKENNGDSSTTK